MISAALVLILAAAPERVVHFVDLEKAVVATADGKRVKEQLEKALAAIEDEVQRRESALAALQKELERTGAPATRAKYESEADALEKYIEREQAALEKKQDEQLAPIIDKMRALIKGRMILDQSALAIVSPRAACDASAWVAQAYESNKKPPLPDKEDCRVKVVFFVDLRRVAAAIGEGKAAVDRLDAFQRSKQAELDQKQRELRALEGKPEHERMRLDLAARYAAYKKELEERQRTEEERVDRVARSEVHQIEAALEGALFVERLDDEVEVGMESCDMAAWLVEVIEKKAAVSSASSRCPAYSAAPKPSPSP